MLFFNIYDYLQAQNLMDCLNEVLNNLLTCVVNFRNGYYLCIQIKLCSHKVFP